MNSKNPIEILVAENGSNVHRGSQMDFRLLSDSTFIFNYSESKWDYEKHETYRGRFTTNDNDTINFFPRNFEFSNRNFEFIESDKAIIKTGFIEFLNGKRPLKMKIVKTILKPKLTFDTIKYSDYAFFAYDSNFYNYFPGAVKSVDLDASDMTALDSLLNLYFNQGGDLNANKSTDYLKQCISVIDSNNEKEVWVNLLCKGSKLNKEYQYYVITVNDGGDCFITMKVNIAKLKYYHVMVNGNG